MVRSQLMAGQRKGPVGPDEQLVDQEAFQGPEC